MKKYIVIIGLGLVIISIVLVSSLLNNRLTTNAISSNTVGLEVGLTAPNFNLTDIDSKYVSRGSLRGKPLMIFFTTTWCTPCQVGAKNLARYDLETGDKTFNVLIVFVDSQETEDQLRTWKQSFGREDWFIAKDNDMAQTYGVQYLDTKYILDKDSIIKWKNLQPLTYETAKQVMEGFI